MTIAPTTTRTPHLLPDDARRDAAAELGWAVVHRLRDLGDDLRGLPVRSPFDPSDTIDWHPLAVENGDLGLALVYSAAAAAAPEDGWDLLAHSHVARAVEAFSASPGLGVGAFSGTAAVGFALASLARGGERYQGALDQVEAELVRRTHAVLDGWDAAGGLATDDYDLVSGIAGAAWYLLQSGRGSPATDGLLDRCLAELSRRATTPPPGGFWTPAGSITEVERRHHAHLHDGYTNLGLAHGITGVLLVLGEARRVGRVVPEEALRALRGALAAETVDSGHGPDIGYHGVHGGFRPAGPTRAAWCYGNPGLALAAAAAGSGDGLPDAVTLIRTLRGRSDTALGVDNPSLCHGYAGLALIEATVTGTASAATVDRLLALRDPGRPLLLTNHQLPGLHTDTPGFLEGAGGAAVALLALSGECPRDATAVRLLTGRGPQ